MSSWFAAPLLAIAALLAGCTVPVTGAGALRSGDYPAAVTAFQAQVAAEPVNWKARALLGYASLKSGDAKSAIPQFEQALTLEPKASMCHVYLGWAQLKLGNQAAALDAWRRFHDPTKPLMQQELDRLGTLVELEQGKKFARQALVAEGQGPAVAPKKNSYAILNFTLTGAVGTLVPLQKALTAMTIADLAQIKGLTVIGRMRTQALLDEMQARAPGAPGAASVSAPASASRAGRLLGAETFVFGGMSEAEGELRIVGSVASASQGAPLGSFELSEEKTRFFELQKQLLAQIIAVKQIKLDPELGRTLPYHFHTLNHEAVVAYGQGLDAQDRQDWLAAQGYFAQAAKLDPFFLLARMARDRVPVGISIRVGQQASGDAVGSRIEAVAMAQGLSPTSTTDPAPTPGRLPSTAPPPAARTGG